MRIESIAAKEQWVFKDNIKRPAYAVTLILPVEDLEEVTDREGRTEVMLQLGREMVYAIDRLEGIPAHD